MRGLAAIRTRDRLDVLRPAPARFERGFAHDTIADRQDLNAALVRRVNPVQRPAGATTSSAVWRAAQPSWSVLIV
jgi:hypothetical protein